MPISLEIKSKICDLYTNGHSIKQIRTLVNVSEITISRILKSHNINIRRDNGQSLNISKTEVNQLYNNGMSTYAIAAHFKCSSETIRKLVDEIRPSCERNILSELAKQKISTKSSRNWKNASYVRAVAEGKDEDYYIKLKKSSAANYASTLGAWIADPSNHKTISEALKTIWNDPEYRAKQAVYFQERGERLSRASKKSLLVPSNREQWIQKIRQNNTIRKRGWVSSSQKQLYYILEESDIAFYEEGPDTKVGPFNVVDCVIPIQQSMKRPLVVEVNGEYWHSLPTVAIKDQQKASYIRKNTDYDLLVLSELEMNNYEQVELKLSQYGISLSKIEAKVSDIKISQIDESQASMLYSIFHYTSSIRKGAKTYGAFVGDNLVAAISYTYPLRRSSSDRLKFELKEVMEISRLARKSNFICKNFASWFIAKTIKMLPDAIKAVISFSDHTYGHQGTVYKAANFKEDGIIEPDYTYVSMVGSFHKKTIWDRAKRMKMTEKEYADKHNLLKVYGGHKTRWVYYT